MGLIMLLLAVSLLHSCDARQEVNVLKQKGEDVLLTVMKTDALKQEELFFWKFSSTRSLIRFNPKGEPTFFDPYKQRIEHVQNYTVKLKNLEKADSGFYTASVSGAQEEIIARYNVTVQDVVSPVKVKVDIMSGSSDSCDLTVTCRSQDSHIRSNFTCNATICYQEGGERSEATSSGATLRIYLDSNGSVICNHSNLVSWTKAVETIEHFCSRDDDLKLQSNVLVLAIAVSISILILILIIISTLLFQNHRKRKKNKRESTENTVYEIPQVGTTAQPLGQSPTNDSSGLSPATTYCTVGPHTGPVGSTVTPGTALPESLYAQVEKTPKSFNN